jgi:2-methylcitrate dehydratase PrpD
MPGQPTPNVTTDALRDTDTTLGEALAAFAADLRYEDLLPALVARLQLHTLDLLGVCLVGARMPFADMLHATVAQSGGVEESTLTGRGGVRLPAPSAALFIGGVAHGNEFDDTYPPGRWHPSAAILPALFAAAEPLGASGKAFITATAAAIEVGCRLTRAAPGLLLRGFHSTASAGVLGSALGVGKLMGQGREQLAHGLAIAACFANGTTEFLNDPEAWPKRIQVGYAAQGAVLAARAAGHGFKGPRTMIEGRYGYLRAHAGEGNYDTAGILAGLGTEWELAKIYPKRYPCDHIAQGYLDCALAIAADPAFAPADIERIEVLVNPFATAVMFEPRALRYAPTNGWSARWSMPFNMAVALTDRAIGIDSYTDARAVDPATRALMAKVVPVEEASMPFPGDYPAWIRVHAAGRVFEMKQMQVAGAAGNPMPAEEYEQKFRANASRVLPVERVAALVERMRALPRVSNMEEIAALYA